MYELGKKTEIFGADLLEPIGNSVDLKKWPNLKKGFNLVCGFDQGLGERMIVCENMKDISQLVDSYNNGLALHITWYQGPDAGFIKVM